MLTSTKNREQIFLIFDPTNYVIEEFNIKTDYNQEGTAMDLRWNLTDYNYFLDKSEEEILENFKRQTRILLGLGHSEHIPLDKGTMQLIMQYSINQCEKGKDKILDFYNSSKQLRKLISNGIIKCAKEIEKNPEER